jgi:hypothetical protein
VTGRGDDLRERRSALKTSGIQVIVKPEPNQLPITIERH